MIVNVVQIKYDPLKDMCKEWRIHDKINDEEGMKILKAETAPMYMYMDLFNYGGIPSPGEVYNKKYWKEKRKEKD